MGDVLHPFNHLGGPVVQLWNEVKIAGLWVELAGSDTQCDSLAALNTEAWVQHVEQTVLPRENSQRISMVQVGM